MIFRVFLILLLVAGCGRPLTDTERAFASKIHGEGLNMDRVRFVRGAPLGSVTFKRQARPRVTCRERIAPPPKEEIVTAKPAALALFQKVYFTKQWFLEDYAPDYPEKLFLVEAMLIAHELTHVWQWQNRKVTGYHPLKAASEHVATEDPYLFDIDRTPDFLSYGYEQQASIVEEYVCCRALAPDAARTARLHDMLAAVMPVSALPTAGRESDVYLPWEDVKVRGICD